MRHMGKSTCPHVKHRLLCINTAKILTSQINFHESLPYLISKYLCNSVVPDITHQNFCNFLVQVVDSSDFPAGVVNVLTGDSDCLLATLANHQEVAALWAPGIAATKAKYIEWASSANLKQTWVDKLPYHNLEQVTDYRELFELYSTVTKAIWMPCGEIFAN
jgi:NAD-dependent aldehyde dehydrogenases